MRPRKDFLLLKAQKMTTLITTFLLWIFFWANLCFTVFFILVFLPKEEGGGKESFGQTVSNFNEPLKYLEKLIIDGNLEHDGNPVSSWMFGNCSIYTNTSGLRKIIKQNESLKIDGFVAAMMALGMYLNEQNKEIKSVYESG